MWKTAPPLNRLLAGNLLESRPSRVFVKISQVSKIENVKDLSKLQISFASDSVIFVIYCNLRSVG